MPAREATAAVLQRWRSPRLIAAATSDWVPPAIVVVVTLGMLLASPVWASPDSPMQQITAWHDIHHLLPGTAVLVPLDGAIIPCFAHHAAMAASCTATHPVPLPQASMVAVLNYPPLGFWIMGVGQVLGTLVSDPWASTGGRLLLAVACLLAIIVASRVLVGAEQRSALWMLPVAITPMATFLFAGSNVNGLEIALSALFVALLLAWRRRAEIDQGWTRAELHLGVAALGLAACKPGDWLWIVLLLGAAGLRWRRTLDVASGIRAVAACTPAVAASLVWSWIHPTVITSAGLHGAATTHPLSLPARLAHSIGHLQNVVMEAWGVVGWLDTSPGRPFFVLLIVGTAFLASRVIVTTSDRLYLLSSVILVLAVATVGNAVEWNGWPNWWQGRYSLPLIVGLALLLVEDKRNEPRPGMRSWAGFSAVTSAAMVLLVELRFAAGLRWFFVPVALRPMLDDPLRTTAVGAIVVTLVVVGLLLMATDPVEGRRRGRSMAGPTGVRSG